MDQENTEKFKCKNCGEAEFDTEQQLRGHQMKCRPKDKVDIRKERVPFGVPAQRFNVPENDGFHYHVFNDNWKKEPGRIQRALKAGYEVVDDEQSGSTVGTNEDGSEFKGILMRIPKELYDEDQAVKNKELDKIDEQINRGRFDDKLTQAYGDVKVQTKLTG